MSGRRCSFKVEHAGRGLPHRHLPDGLLPGNGARLVATVNPSATLPQTQPACLTEPTTGLVDCGNWAVSASWAVPATAVSGIYFAKLDRGPTHRRRQPHRLRRPQRRQPLRHPVPDLGHDLAGLQQLRRQQPVHGQPGGPRPTRSATTAVQHRVRPAPRTSSSTPSTRWCAGSRQRLRRQLLHRRRHRPSAATSAHEPQDRSCRSATTSTGRASSAPTSRRPGTPASTSRSSAATRSSGRPAGRTASTARGTPYRTLVCYKETHANAVIDPQDPPTWTGTWRDPRFSPPADGGRPENALTGTIFMVNGGSDTDAITGAGRRRQDAVLAQHERRRRSRRAQTATLPTGTLGYEWDEDLDNGFRPAGLIDLSTTTLDVVAGPAAGLRLHVRRRHGDPPPDPVPRAERRARLRRRHGAVVLGPRRDHDRDGDRRRRPACSRRR